MNSTKSRNVFDSRAVYTVYIDQRMNEERILELHVSTHSPPTLSFLSWEMNFPMNHIYNILETLKIDITICIQHQVYAYAMVKKANLGGTYRVEMVAGSVVLNVQCGTQCQYVALSCNRRQTVEIMIRYTKDSCFTCTLRPWRKYWSIFLI